MKRVAIACFRPNPSATLVSLGERLPAVSVNGRLSGTAGGIVRLLGLRSGGGRQAPDRTAPTGGLIGADPPPEGGRTVTFWILDGIAGPPVQQDRLAFGEQWVRSAQRTPGSRVTINDDRARAVCS